jgi:hypothetical protein
MSDNEWSDDENTVPEQNELLMPEEEENSDYEEERMYVLNLFKKREKETPNYYNNFDENTLVKNKTKNKNKTEKKQQCENKNLLEIDLRVSYSPETAKKGWVSKRMEEKKIKEGKVTEAKRHFNPRLPYPKLNKNRNKKEEKNTFTLGDEDFPSL